MINQDGSFLHVVEDSSVLVEDDILNIMRVPKHEEKVIRLLSNLLDVLPLSASCDELLSLALSPSID